MIINRLIEEHEMEQREKKNPNQHFIIDFRYMLLARLIRCELGDSSKAVMYEKFTKYNVHYLINRIVKKYGN